MRTFDCTDIKAILSGLVDGEVDTETRHLAERHIADCRACRDLLDETERMHDLISAQSTSVGSSLELSSSFIGGVMSRTVYAEAFQFAGRRWTSWMGWVAAAACLLLALTVWIVDRQPIAQNVAVSPQRTTPVQSVPTSTYFTGGKSWTFDGALSPDALGLPRKMAETVVPAQLVNTNTQPNVVASSVPAVWSKTEEILPDDADALYAASLLLDMLSEADLTSFADVEQIRRVAEYDQLLERLSGVRHRLTDADRPVVLATETILHRIIHGPFGLDDLQLMRDTVRRLDLAGEVHALTTVRERDISL